MMHIFKRKTFNDTLALLMLPGLPSMWMASHWLPLPGEIIGATIGGWTLVIQHYFRKSPPNENGK